MQWFHPAAGLEVVGSVQLTATAHDLGLAEEHARREQASDLEHEDEMRRLTHLQHVLADPDLCRVWWIAKFPDRHGELAQLTTQLEDLPSPHEPGDEDIRGDIRHFTDRLLTSLHTPQQREIFLKALTQALHTLGHHELKTTAAQWQAPNDPGSTPA